MKFEVRGSDAGPVLFDTRDVKPDNSPLALFRRPVLRSAPSFHFKHQTSNLTLPLLWLCLARIVPGALHSAFLASKVSDPAELALFDTAPAPQSAIRASRPRLTSNIKLLTSHFPLALFRTVGPAFVGAGLKPARTPQGVVYVGRAVPAVRLSGRPPNEPPRVIFYELVASIQCCMVTIHDRLFCVKVNPDDSPGFPPGTRRPAEVVNEQPTTINQQP